MPPLATPFITRFRATTSGVDRLNSGVPLALTGNSDIAAQFDHFTRLILEPDARRGAAAFRAAPYRARAPRIHLVTTYVHHRDARCFRPPPQPPARQQYLELKANVHRKLLNA